MARTGRRRRRSVAKKTRGGGKQTRGKQTRGNRVQNPLDTDDAPRFFEGYPLYKDLRIKNTPFTTEEIIKLKEGWSTNDKDFVNDFQEDFDQIEDLLLHGAYTKDHIYFFTHPAGGQ